ncbi:MAG: NB-ARC domain-containing protein [Chloroflexota bacterium]|nr:NB-ARC domain-containing protein [Chloroflexota bacterium]
MQEEISFGTWLRKQRRALDLSQKVLANQVGCAEVTLRRIEAGTLKPSKELASLLMEKLGIPDPERSNWISFARGVSAFPPSVTPSSSEPITNLPAPLTTFIGRDREQADVLELIAKHRLVTLTGPGGIGKSRLSVKVGEQIPGDYPDGVWLVELASIVDSALVPHTAALTLGLREDPKRKVTDTLCDFLRPKRILLLLDNCEHLLDACAQLIDRLLRTCPQLRVLATSRESLNITGEAVYHVPSLGLPNQQELFESLRNYESMQLFEERAQLVQFGFSLTAENIASVAQICHRLDGIPLAIELAAAKLAMFSTEQISKQLHESFNLLIQGSRTAMPRHQTLRASIDWSWDLLTDEEQRLMRQLSVFAGGWTLEAAQSVCDGDVLNLLNSLVSKSLIVINQRTETHVRYSVHETIRQYAREKLMEAGGVEALRDRHLAYFVQLIEQAEPELYRSNQVFWFKKLDDELDNFRLAIEWSLATDVAAGLRILAFPWRFWQRRNNFRELADWLSGLLERYSASDSLRAQALVAHCVYIIRSGSLAEARQAVEQALQLARTVGDRQTEALSLLYLGAALQDEHIQQSIPLLEQSLALYRTLEDKIGHATALYWLAWIKNRHDSDDQKPLLVESLKLHRDLGNLTGIADCLSELALHAIWRGDFSSPVPWLKEARKIYHEHGAQADEADIMVYSGTIAYGQGDYRKARSYFEESLRLFGSVGVWWSIYSNVNLAYMDLRQGDIPKARIAFAEVIQRAYKENYMDVLLWATEGMASLQVDQRQFECAAQLLAWVDTKRAKLRNFRPVIEQTYYERDMAVIHTELDEAEIAKLVEEGRAMTVEQAVALALKPAAEDLTEIELPRATKTKSRTNPASSYRKRKQTP